MRDGINADHFLMIFDTNNNVIDVCDSSDSCKCMICVDSSERYRLNMFAQHQDDTSHS